MKENTKGAIAVFCVYMLWGSLPIYWKQMGALDAMEILAHRALWSGVFAVLLVILTRRTKNLVSLFRRDVRSGVLLLLSGIAVSVNWFIYIWAVNEGKVLESSLGYFMNPLVSILFGVVIFRERLRKMQWAAIAVAALGVCAEVAALGRAPMVSLGLAFSFGVYALLKKMVAADPLTGMAVETLILMPFALLWLAWRQRIGMAHFPYPAALTFLLLSTGAVTVLPLILFAWGVRRCPLTIVGLVQYTSPILMFLSAVLLYHEALPPLRQLSFALTWTGIALFTLESFLYVKKRGNL
jgi:chloramphenicol-sensitive protein RarD